MKRILLVTGNPRKLEEVRRIVEANGVEGFEFNSVDMDLKELQGEPLDVAIAKCLEARATLDEKRIPYDGVLIDDSALCFTALGGLPGVFIKWFEKLGLNGLVNMLAAYEDKSCYAQCTFALAFRKQGVETFVGQTFGKVVSPRYHANGNKGFGWDAIVEVDGKTYAEMENEEKDLISHRARALEKLLVYLKEFENKPVVEKKERKKRKNT